MSPEAPKWTCSKGTCSPTSGSLTTTVTFGLPPARVSDDLDDLAKIEAACGTSKEKAEALVCEVKVKPEGEDYLVALGKKRKFIAEIKPDGITVIGKVQWSSTGATIYVTDKSGPHHREVMVQAGGQGGWATLKAKVTLKYDLQTVTCSGEFKIPVVDIESVTVSEDGNESNQVMATPNQEKITVPLRKKGQGNAMEAKINVTGAILPDNLRQKYGKFCLVKCKGETKNLKQDCSFNLGGTSFMYVLDAGPDMNENGVLDPGEAKCHVSIYVVKIEITELGWPDPTEPTDDDFTTVGESLEGEVKVTGFSTGPAAKFNMLVDPSAVAGVSPTDFSLSIGETGPFTLTGTGPGVAKVKAKAGSNVYAEKEFTVFKVEILSVSPSPYTPACGGSGQDLTIEYKIEPASFTGYSGQLTVADKNGTVVYTDTNVPLTGGTHTVTWSGSSDSLKAVKYADSPYEIKVEITKASATAEDTVSLAVVDVADITMCWIATQRTSIPTELLLPLYRTREHFEIGGKFRFALDLGGKLPPYNVQWDLWDTDGWNDLLSTGLGTDFEHTLTTEDDGDAYVKFYCDGNDNYQWDEGENHRDSPEFRVMTKYSHALKFAKSSKIAGALGVAGACDTASDLLLEKHLAVDWRAAVEFSQTGATATIPHGGHDPVDVELTGSPGSYEVEDTWGHLEYFKDNNATNAHVIVVDGYRRVDASGVFMYNLGGSSKQGTKYEIFLRRARLDGNTLAHEVGHSCNLGDTDAGSVDQVMWYSSDGNETLLSRSEAKAYDGGP